MDLITTHINADFDALGSLVAAKKLYPHSRLLLPGSQEKAVRDFLALAKDLVTIESERECKIDDIGRLILVDTRHKSRIGIAATLIDKNVEVHIYDHHPAMKGDIVADEDISEEVGATVTILADILKKKRVKLSPLEATIMLLGIYEETGSLTYRTTTRLDVDIVSFLLSQGANLSIVSSYLNRELSEGELSLLARLITNTERVTVKGIDVSMVTIESEDYAGELGMVIHKLMDIENIPVLFVFIDTKHERVDIIARSKLPGVDVNKIMSHFGGGGHVSAAGAKIHNVNMPSVKNKLMRILKENIKIRLYAKDVMSKDVTALNMNDRIVDAKKMLIDRNVSGMPVVNSKGRLIGIITRDGLNKAIKRDFGHSRVKGYMSPNIVTTRPDTPLHSITRIVQDKDIAVIPVVKGSRMIGVIHRTAILRNVYDNLFAKPLAVRKKVTLNVSKKMTSMMPKEIMVLLKKIGSVANAHGYGAFVVGGMVRDLVLGVKNLDLDIVIEGEAIKLGHALSHELKASLVVHKRFGTCSIITKKGLKIDLATARKETYEKPAALPTVEFSSLKDDLIRRDFTINAMAISINKTSFGQLIDFFGGEHDLARGRIAVMHDASFIDDPTRIFRAVRFEQRFGFSIDSHTEELIKSAIEIEMFDKVQPQRIRDELISILKERHPLKALRRMAELDELRFLHPDIRLDDKTIRLCKSVEDIYGWYDRASFKKRAVEKWLMYLMALFDRLSYRDVSNLCGRFVFRGSETLRVLSYKKYADKAVKALSASRGISPSDIYKTLEPLSFEVILLIMAKANSGPAKPHIKDFFRKINGSRITIKGGDIEALGLKPCPGFKVILKKVLYAKIDGAVKTKKDELGYAARLVKRIRE